MRNFVFSVLIAFSIHVSAAEKDAPDTKSASYSGKVVQSTNAASYTYVLVNTGKQQIWAAAPRFSVKTGDTVAFANGMAMSNYQSKTLNRTFDVVYFTEGMTVNGATPETTASTTLPKGHPPVAGAGTIELPKGHPALPNTSNATELPKGHPPITGGPAKSTVDLRGIQKAPGGMTVGEICKDAAKLKGKQVKVRAKVVKYNAMIMGKNWLHLRDGTGSEGSNDLLVTSATSAKVGDTVLITGTVAVNKDFGANYKYPVMVEDGKVTVE